MPDTAALDRAESLIRTIPDYPSPGIQFRDITPLLADAAALHAVTRALIEPFADGFDVVGGIEARGFLLAGAIAAEAGVGLVPIRKAGKLPRPAASVSYALKYGEAAIEAHDDLAPDTRILLVDDVLATGGTIAAARELMTTLGTEVIGTTVLLELEGLNGRAVAGDVHALFVV